MPENSDPPAKMLKAFERAEQLKDSAVLSYPLLEIEEQYAKDQDNRIFTEFLESEPGGVREDERARVAAVGNFIRTGRLLQHVSEGQREIVANRFTEASKELYGVPEPHRVAHKLWQNLNTKHVAYLAAISCHKDI